MAETYPKALNVRFLPSPRLDKNVAAPFRHDLRQVGLLSECEEVFSQPGVVYLGPVDFYIHAKSAAEAKGEDREAVDFGHAEVKVGSVHDPGPTPSLATELDHLRWCVQVISDDLAQHHRAADIAVPGRDAEILTRPVEFLWTEYVGGPRL
jgi:hypothetical protein